MVDSVCTCNHLGSIYFGKLTFFQGIVGLDAEGQRAIGKGSSVPPEVDQ